MTPAQREIIDEMRSGKKLSALLSTAPGFGRGQMPFKAALEGRLHRINIATVNAMLKAGLIEEAERLTISFNCCEVVYRVKA